MELKRNESHTQVGLRVSKVVPGGAAHDRFRNRPPAPPFPLSPPPFPLPLDLMLARMRVLLEPVMR